VDLVLGQPVPANDLETNSISRGWNMAKQVQVKKATKATKGGKPKDKAINTDSPSGKIKHKN